MTTHKKRIFGDYQTPPDFARRICLYLKDQLHLQPDTVLEPTCGLGHFLQASLLFEAKAYYGIELNPEYCQQCRNSLPDSKVHIIQASIFGFDTRALLTGGNASELLILGNPPWVTCSTLSALHSDALPPKSSQAGLTGLEAITGSSNFDVCEAIILQLLQEYARTSAVLAMLCKTATARKVYAQLCLRHIPFECCDILEFDASEVFGIEADACLLTVRLSPAEHVQSVCRIYDLARPDTVKQELYCSPDGLCLPVQAPYPDFEGSCCFEWRQGVKHDCAAVMELVPCAGLWRNGLQEQVRLEEKQVFALAKSSMLRQPVLHTFSRAVLLTQHHTGEDTGRLQQEAPLTWQYLQQHRAFFERRKSKVYQKAPPFALFGIGPYSFARYKVAVSGFYTKPVFTLLYSPDGRPVMTDDTCYFLSFEEYELAYTAMLLLNSAPVQSFLTARAFQGAKRPYTKKLLSRLNLQAICQALSLQELQATEQALHLPPVLTEKMWQRFRDTVQSYSHTGTK